MNKSSALGKFPQHCFPYTQGVDLRDRPSEEGLRLRCAEKLSGPHLCVLWSMVSPVLCLALCALPLQCQVPLSSEDRNKEARSIDVARDP